MQSSEEIIKSLGKGVYGSVDLVKYTKSDGSSFHVAVKTSKSRYYDALYKEFRILSELHGSPNIVQCFGDDLVEDLNPNGERVIKLLLEHATEGSLRAFMDNYTDSKLPEPMIRDFTRMILQGLVSIHDYDNVHCDLKSDNILVFLRGDSAYELKIADFGNSIQAGEIPDYWAVDYPYIGTPNYMPPESFRRGVANKTLDLWSLGCLVLEMYTGKKPWSGFRTVDFECLLLDGKAPEIPESVPCDAREFIETCFARKPEERGTASELLNHRFLPRGEEKTEEEVVAVSDDDREAINLWLLELRDSKKPMDSQEKPLSSKNVFLSKPPQLKQIWNKLFRFKIRPMKPSSFSNLVSVQ